METPESGERWALVERVAAGTTLQRSARLRQLLLHVGRHSIYGDGSPLHEAEVGRIVFGRPSRYDTSQDNIVRVNFSELRKRIQQYFREEGRSEPVEFDIPRGSYELRFRARPLDAFDRAVMDAAETGSEAVPEEPTLIGVDGVAQSASEVQQSEQKPRDSSPTTAHGVKRWIFTCYLLGAVALCATIAALWLWRDDVKTRRDLMAWSSGPTLERFWKPFMGGGEPADIVLADSSLALAQDLSGGTVSLSDYIGYNYQSLYDAEAARGQPDGVSKLLLSRNTGSVGDFKVAAMIHAIAPASASRIVFARDDTAAAVRDHNSVLLGSRRSNPWVELLEDQLQYRFSSSPDRRETFITVVHPKQGEQVQYVSSADPSTRVSYGVIAVLPSPGGAAHTLVIAGTDSQATLAAGQLLTNEAKLEELSRMIGSGPMDHMQVLIRAETMRWTPIATKILSVRTDF